MRIPDNIILELHNLDCEEVAKRFGIETKRHMCHCFKHEDYVPSLGFRRNHWKCFSCDIGGDAITLAQELYSVSFLDACIILAEEYGIQIPDVKQRSHKWHESIILLRHRVQPNDATTIFDREIAEFIMKSSSLTPSGMEFLQNERKIGVDVIDSSHIHSLDNMNELRRNLVAKFGIDRLIKAKLLRGNNKYLTIDTPSLIIPYYDINEQLIGLQTRYLGEDNPNFHIPRFKRICCSPIRLYNLPILNKIGVNEKLFITEGITDCLAMLSRGYKAVAIPSATSFPIEDLARLKKFNLYMVADNDRAGNEAFIKLYRLMLRYGCELKRVQLPSGVKDFCEYHTKVIEG
ncbi:MAG: CHC2 zinc finger domain-containing protein [Muribaculum sp.]|nr:CHC2 zinc finger domain-containing protein [Muribaculum sp.]